MLFFMIHQMIDSVTIYSNVEKTLPLIEFTILKTDETINHYIEKFQISNSRPRNLRLT